MKRIIDYTIIDLGLTLMGILIGLWIAKEFIEPLFN